MPRGYSSGELLTVLEVHNSFGKRLAWWMSQMKELGGGFQWLKLAWWMSQKKELGFFWWMKIVLSDYEGDCERKE